MKKKNVVKKDVREKKTLRRSAIRPVKPTIIKKVEPVVVTKEAEEGMLEATFENTTQNDPAPKKQRKNKPAPVVEQENIIEENNQ